MKIDTLAIVGAGTMGTGIAQLAAQAGLRVFLMDSSESALSASPRRLDDSLRGGITRGKLTPEEAEEAKARISWHAGLERVAEADWVIEAVFEDRAVKRDVYLGIAQRAAPTVPLATNTSTFPIGELAGLTDRPEIFLGMHFFNPPPAMKLVEIVPSQQTKPEVTQAAIDLCLRMGRNPLLAPDVPGFVVNRVLAALFTAAIELWEIGGNPETIDASLEMGLAHKMGPLKTADLIGLDVMLSILRSLYEQTGHPRFEPPAAFVRLVESGKLGRKSGEGFYHYEQDGAS